MEAMAALLENATLVVTEGVEWIKLTVGSITAAGNELLQMFVLLGLVGAGIGLVRRIIG
ncbi:MAG: hypothetical protein IKK14_05890 [Oscillospiraceae bacterium]|nr:hypothetical protein [Oscillospiraceae bacterium]